MKTISIFLTMFLITTAMVFGQTIKTYNGPFKAKEHGFSGIANYEYFDTDTGRVFHGKFSFRLEDNSFKITGNFLNNKRDGKWNLHYDNFREWYQGRVYRESSKMYGKYVKGNLHGPWVFERTSLDDGTSYKSHVNFNKNRFTGSFEYEGDRSISETFHNNVKINGQFDVNGFVDDKWIVSYTDPWSDIKYIETLYFKNGVLIKATKKNTSTGDIEISDNSKKAKNFFKNLDTAKNQAVLDQKVYTLSQGKIMDYIPNYSAADLFSTSLFGAIKDINAIFEIWIEPSQSYSLDYMGVMDRGNNNIYYPYNIIRLDEEATEELKANIRRQKQLEQKAYDFIEKADLHSNREEFDDAIKNYKKALQLNILNEEDIRQMIVEAENRKIEKIEREYSSLISKADSNYEQNNYEIAISYYKSASKLKPNEDYPYNRIEEAETNINILKEEKYNSAIKEGDNCLSNRDYKQAIVYYNEALNIKPNEIHPLSKAIYINHNNITSTFRPTLVQRFDAFFSPYDRGRVAERKIIFNAYKIVYNKIMQDYSKNPNYLSNLKNIQSIIQSIRRDTIYMSLSQQLKNEHDYNIIINIFQSTY